MARSLNRVELIGNLTRDPELRYTPQGTAVCTFGVATNRTWQTDNGEKKEDTEFHRVVAWNKLAELCSQLLTKGRKVFVEGRLQTRTWTGQDGAQRSTTEIVISDMLILDNKRAGFGDDEYSQAAGVEEQVSQVTEEKQDDQAENTAPAKKASKKVVKEESVDQDINPDDIPF